MGTSLEGTIASEIGNEWVNQGEGASEFFKKSRQNLPLAEHSRFSTSAKAPKNKGTSPKKVKIYFTEEKRAKEKEQPVGTGKVHRCAMG